MKKSFFILFTAIIFVILANSLALQGNASSEPCYLHPNYDKDYENVNLRDEFDYNFNGRVESFINTSQYNGYGTEIPYSYFYVNVTKKSKGEVETRVIIKFYGGYNEENQLILVDGLAYPQIGMEYSFYCNKTKISYESDHRTMNDSFVISMKYNMQSLEDEETDDTSSHPSRPPKKAPRPTYDLIKDPSAGSPTNYSFEEAYDIKLEEETRIGINPGKDRYYKFTAPSLEYFAVYTSKYEHYTPKVEVYNANYEPQTKENFYQDTSHIAPDDNFFLAFYAEKNTVVYIRVFSDTASETLYSCVNLNVIKYNYHQTDVLSLVNDDCCVGDDKKIDYTIKSKYLTEIDFAIKEWSKLETVKFVPDTAGTINNLTISDFSDEDGVFGYTESHKILAYQIKLNDYHFAKFSVFQRKHTVLHEFGHALGLKDFTGLESKLHNVMVQGANILNRLGPADIAAYRWKHNMIA